MAIAVTQPASGAEKIVLAIDIGGSHVKILTSAGGTERRVELRARAHAATDGRCGEDSG